MNDIRKKNKDTENFLKGLTKLTGIPYKKVQQYVKDNNPFNILEHPQTLEPSTRQLEKIELLNKFISSYNLLKVYENENRIKLSTSTKSGQYFVSLLSGIKDKEKFLVAFLDTSLNIIETRTISEGTIGETAVYPREILKAAISCDCKSMVLAHNHPGNSTNPSPEDRQITQKLIDIFTPLGINILDHIIVGGTAYCSLTDRGDMPQYSNLPANYEPVTLAKDYLLETIYDDDWEKEFD